MKRKFKSNIFKSCFLSATVALLAFSISLIVMLALDRSEHIMETLPIMICSSIVPAVLSFIFWNISIEVDTNEVVFLRSGKPYLRINITEHFFLMKTNYRTPTLRVLSIHTDAVKEYRFDNFTHKTLGTCCEYIHEIQDFKVPLINGGTIDLKKFWKQL